MPTNRARDDDDSTIVEEAPTIPPTPETIKVQRLLLAVLASAFIALALALPLYGLSTLWVGPGAIFLSYIYGVTVLVKIHQQKKLVPAEDGKSHKERVPVVTRRATYVCAWLLAVIWIAACAIGIWRAGVDLRAGVGGVSDIQVAWVVLRFIECLCYLGGGITLAFVGFLCKRARECILQQISDTPLTMHDR